MNPQDQKYNDVIENNPELREQLKQLVLERLNVMPSSLRVAIGDSSFSMNDLIGHVKEGDDIGKQMIQMDLEFLRDLVSGAIYGVNFAVI